MPIIEVFAEVKSLGFTAIRVLTSLIADTFNRTSSGSLGLSSTASKPWSAIKGTWYANGVQAQSDDAAANYSVATVQTDSPNVTVSTSVSGGVGVAFWVSDAGSWWAAVPYYSTYTYNIAPCTCGTSSYTPPSGACPNCNCGTNYFTPSSGTYPNCNCGTTYTPQSPSAYPDCACPCGGGGSYTTTFVTCVAFSPANCTENGGTYGGGGVCNSGSGSCRFTEVTTGCNFCLNCATCDACATTCYSCQSCATQTTCNPCGTATGYSYALTLLSSMSAVVSQVSSTSLSTTATAVKVITSGDTITAQAYSDTSLTSPLNSAISYSATGSTKTTNHGIIKSPTSVSQGSTADNFSVSL